MTMLKLKTPLDKSFNNLMTDFFPEFPSILKNEWNGNDGHYSVPVNIRETENGYHLELVVPGWNKEDFKISVDQHLLTISAEVKAEEEKKEEKMIRKEFTFRSFKRSFTVTDKINTDLIEAKYVNGILTLNLPKKEEVKAASKEISVA